MLKSTSASHAQSPKEEISAILGRLGIDPSSPSGELAARSPIDGRIIGKFPATGETEVRDAIEMAEAAFKAWRRIPAPQRGEFVRLLGEELRAAKSDLGRLITLEVGKIASEGLGEVQEMIDICDFAVGLSRQLYGLTMATERPDHRMMETWHPYGVCGVITAFNFPGAVWSWNAAIALVCGNSIVWKPSEKTLLTSLAIRRVFYAAAERFGGVPDGLLEVLVGASSVGEILVDDPRVGIVSATGSTRMGKQVATRLA
ncbi:MAG: aldehyde dehydrogenase family protein, partial [Aestuariivirgaceae bacterium]